MTILRKEAAMKNASRVAMHGYAVVGKENSFESDLTLLVVTMAKTEGIVHGRGKKRRK